MPTVEYIHPILIHVLNKLVRPSPLFLHSYIIFTLLPGQLNTKDTGTPQVTPGNSLRRTGTILSKASALSQFSSYGKIVTNLPPPSGVMSHVSTAESDDYAEVIASEVQNGMSP